MHDSIAIDFDPKLARCLLQGRKAAAIEFDPRDKAALAHVAAACLAMMSDDEHGVHHCSLYRAAVDAVEQLAPLFGHGGSGPAAAQTVVGSSEQYEALRVE